MNEISGELGFVEFPVEVDFGRIVSKAGTSFSLLSSGKEAKLAFGFTHERREERAFLVLLEGCPSLRLENIVCEINRNDNEPDPLPMALTSQDLWPQEALLLNSIDLFTCGERRTLFLRLSFGLMRLPERRIGVVPACEEDEDEKELTMVESVDFMRKKIDVHRYFSVEVPGKEPKLFSIRIVRNPSDHSKGQVQLRAAYPDQEWATELSMLFVQTDMGGGVEQELSYAPKTQYEGSVFPLLLDIKVPLIGTYQCIMKFKMRFPAMATLSQCGQVLGGSISDIIAYVIPPDRAKNPKLLIEMIVSLQRSAGCALSEKVPKMDDLTLGQSVHYVSAILAQSDGLETLFERNEEALRSLSRRGDEFWLCLSQDTTFSGLSPEVLEAQVNFLFEKLQGLSAGEALPLPVPPKASFTRYQNCVLFCELYEVAPKRPLPFPVSHNAIAGLLGKSPWFPKDISKNDAENIYSKLKGFLNNLLIVQISQEGHKILQTVNQMCRSGNFHNVEEMTRWERAAEILSSHYPKWSLNALDVECTYNNYSAMYKYDYQEDEGTMNEESQGDDVELPMIQCLTPLIAQQDILTFEMIGLTLAATFKNPEDLNYLLMRDSIAWRPAFHRIDKYWERLSRNPVLRSRSWKSVKAQTISLLSEIDKLSSYRIPHLNKYEIAPLHNFTYEQNMFLIGKALKLDTLAPFTPVISTIDMIDILSESGIFGGYISPAGFPMLQLRIKGLISYLEPPLSPNEREMLDTIRQVQRRIEIDASEERFWESLKYVKNIDIPEENRDEAIERHKENIDILKENYDKAMGLYRSCKIVQATKREQEADQFLAPACSSLKRTSEEDLRDQEKRRKSPNSQ
ncbi:MAG: hypothetical protein M1840_006720 [Geoglossum simile]|nr:MAG: hypothetical protein M1840_006720 [Geoglossum simile]